MDEAKYSKYQGELTRRKAEISEKVGGERLVGRGSGGCSLEGMRLRSENRKPVKELRVMPKPKE